MDPFERKIIETLRDQKPLTFQEILSKVDFTHNTLRQHLDQLLVRRLVERHKRSQDGPGRPVYLYSIPENVSGRPLAAILDPKMRLVVISFDVFGSGNVWTTLSETSLMQPHISRLPIREARNRGFST